MEKANLRRPIIKLRIKLLAILLNLKVIEVLIKHNYLILKQAPPV
jgi:hypothetical protein